MADKDKDPAGREYQRGVRDGKAGEYNPPHESLVKEFITSYTKDELEDRKDYKDGYHHGKKDR